MQVDHTVRSTTRPLLAAWMLVCALLLQPLAAAVSGTACDAAGDCCCSGEAVPDDATRSSCCSTPVAPEHHSEPTLQSNDCGCRMEDGVPDGPLTPALSPGVVHELGDDDSPDCAPLPASLVGSFAPRIARAPRDDGGPPGQLSLLVRRLQTGGLNAHLARLATLRR